ncbi:MAG: DNA replication and repair protein RecF [Actinobacteria bacterium]|nr:DNA replication and repair protein RecF [Actinomycetota bacterium]
MIVERLNAREFRTYERLEVELGERVTVVTGDNGAGKTNLLEALYFGCVGRSCRTHVDAQTVRFDRPVARVEVEGSDETDAHTLAVAVDRKEGKTFFADGAKVDSLEPFTWRPPVAVFMPDRLELVKGAPGVRRAHLDQFVAALWPGRRAARRAYAEALAQRNALLARGGGATEVLNTWDRELARTGVELTANRAAAIEQITLRFTVMADELGLSGSPGLRYRASAAEATEESFVQQLAERRESDLARGFSTFGPHRDEVVVSLDGREVRTYGSQGQQRLSLLAMLLAECEAITRVTARSPLILLDDVMSELDAKRRDKLVERVSDLGQVLITATERAHVPESAPVDLELAVFDGSARPTGGNRLSA